MHIKHNADRNEVELWDGEHFLASWNDVFKDISDSQRNIMRQMLECAKKQGEEHFRIKLKRVFDVGF